MEWGGRDIGEFALRLCFNFWKKCEGGSGEGVVGQGYGGRGRKGRGSCRRRVWREWEGEL